MNAKILAVLLGLGLMGTVSPVAATSPSPSSPTPLPGTFASAKTDEAARKRVWALEDVVEKAIVLLKEKKHEEVIALLMVPAELAKIKADEAKYAKAMEKFANKKAAKLLLVLEDLWEFGPDTWNKDATRAEFEAEPRPLVFIWVGGAWRIEEK